MDKQIRIISERISLSELKKMAGERFGDMVKVVVDVEQKIMAVGGEMHADEEAELLENGSKQSDLWGINLYVDMPLAEMVEFNSLINIRPRQNNRSRSVENEKVRKKIAEIVSNLIR